MKCTRKDILPISVLIVCAIICAIVTAVRASRPSRLALDKPVVWYGPAPHPYISEVRNGVTAAGVELGVEVYLMVGQEWSQGNETLNVEALSTKGHKGFAIYPADPAGANGLFAQLKSRGQMVVSYGAEPSLPTPASFTVATDVQAAAEAATEELIRRMGGHGKILNILETVTDVNTQKRDAGVKAVVARHPEVSIVQTISDMSQESEAITKIQSAMAARAGEIDGMIATGYTPTVAAASLLTEWKKDPAHKPIHFVGIDTDPRVVQAIKDGAIDATVAQNTYGHGAIPIAILQLAAQGWTPVEPYKFINSGIVIVDQTNLDTYPESFHKLTRQIMDDLKTKYLSPPAKK